MSITVTHSEVTYRYLMNKSKSDLMYWVNDLRKPTGKRELNHSDAAWLTKDGMATEILRTIRAAEAQEAAEPQAFDDLDIPFGAVTTDVEGKRWVFVGWASTSVSREAYLTRELQRGDRLSPVTPWGYHCTKTETLLKKFPALALYHRATRSGL
jgi:hypothetical protein